MIVFPCPRCQATLKAPEERAGAPSKCPYCGNPVQVPRTAAGRWAALVGHPVSNPPVLANVLPVATPAKAQIPDNEVLAFAGPKPVPRRLPRWVLPVCIPVGVLLLCLVVVGIVLKIKSSPEAPGGSTDSAAPIDISIQYIDDTGHEDLDELKKLEGKLVRLVDAKVYCLPKGMNAGSFFQSIAVENCVQMQQRFYPARWAGQGHYLDQHIYCTLAADSGEFPGIYSLNHGRVHIVGIYKGGNMVECHYR